ncbi:hypothetical protein SGM_3812 [Streptomyces griseoaurantiacus M045]|uniref:Uncharacterized protein n=1 Tax=Streptomyces griseoaurantiacus M045 TaxID=996637 RepID=F3NKZ8_9ACTN|nr:hypothetical protein SGM_3812 [Streptomyces griseoaurantiacus M045]
MPRFGARAPAILSHRSPRAARPPSCRARARLWFRLLLCGGCSNPIRMARNVTVSRSDDHFDALAGRRT